MSSTTQCLRVCPLGCWTTIGSLVGLVFGLSGSVAFAAQPPQPEIGTSTRSVGASDGAAAPNSDNTESESGLFEQALAGGESPSSTGVLGGKPANFDLYGYVRTDLFAGPNPAPGGPRMQAAYGELALKLKVSPERYGSAYAELRLRQGLEGVDPEQKLDLREAYVDGHFGPVDVRLGKQIIVWGRADAFNPTNNLTAVDLRVRSPVEDDRRIGSVALRSYLNLTPMRLEYVWVPLYTPVELPSVQIPDFIALGPTDYPSPELSHGLQAGRLHLLLPSVEASVSYLYGYAPLPGLALDDFTVGVDPTVITISRTAYRHHVVGLDFSTAIGDLVAVRGEAAYRRPERKGARVYVPRRDLQYVLGLDRSFGPVSAIAQYIGRYVFNFRRERSAEEQLDPSILSSWDPPLPATLEQTVVDAIDQELAVRNQILFAQTAKVQHALSARLEWLTLRETLSLSALGMLNLTTKEWLVFPKISYQLSDRMSTAIGGEIYQGPDGTLLGLIDNTLTAGYAELRLTY